ncbi:MAG: hypothetical protein L0229_27655 [Blastocatellia bacterium]|nr:hypothetical protein [Blastocatellia bacterium]
MMRFRFSLFEALSILVLLSSVAVARPAVSIQQTDRVVVRGRVVCLNEQGKPLTGDCPDLPSAFGLKSNDGKLYRFLTEDTATAIFTDARVRARELQITAVTRSQDRLEIIKIQSVKEGKLYDLYYFCEVCNIITYEPGLCMCCREETEFRETPVPEP